MAEEGASGLGRIQRNNRNCTVSPPIIRTALDPGSPMGMHMHGRATIVSWTVVERRTVVIIRGVRVIVWRRIGVIRIGRHQRWRRWRLVHLKMNLGRNPIFFGKHFSSAEYSCLDELVGLRRERLDDVL